MNIVIKELLGSDNINALTEKINFNFDQLILGGGGPEGPSGGTGLQGVAGPEGIRGSQWFGATGSTTINFPTDGILRDNDFRLSENGDVDYYLNDNWLSAGINLQGPTGPTGPAGNGAITTLEGLSLNAHWSPNPVQLTEYLGRNLINDSDDIEINNAGYLNSGLDFIAFGRGNNSLVLGRYANIFDTQVAGSTYTPPGANSTMQGLPSEESDVPMLMIAQNDYKDPSDVNTSYTNGLSIGLNRTNSGVLYDPALPYNSQEMEYGTFLNISIENRFFDAKFSASEKITIESVTGSQLVLGSATDNITRTDIHDFSSKFDSEVYSEFNLKDSLVIEIIGAGYASTKSGKIVKSDFTYNENKKKFDNPNDLRENTSKSFVSSNDYNEKDSTEIVILNTSTLFNTNGASAYNKDKVENNYSPTTELDSNRKDLPFRLGQTTVKVPVSNPTNGSEVNINLNYQGFGYDQSFISYSSIDSVNLGTNSINPVIDKSLDGVLPNDIQQENVLGYDIKLPLLNQSESLSMSRIGLFPGFFRQQKDGNGNWDIASDPDSKNRKEEFFDAGHKMLPTGSMDLFGSVRVREQGEASTGAKDGYVGINAKDGILKWEEPNKVNTAPTYSLIMFSELASDKFSFYANSQRPLGYSASGKLAYNFRENVNNEGSTAECGAFPGRGSDELKDYFICNGAVLADNRDILIRGPYSKMQGMNVKTDSFDISGSGDQTDFDYTKNYGFIGVNGETHSDLLAEGGVELVDAYLGGSLSNRLVTGGVYGLSKPAPRDYGDSGFRIVLPNYFGKVPKMILPDSDFLIRATSGEQLNSNSLHNDSGYLYYTENTNSASVTNRFYNGSWIMNGCFDTIGFPYLEQNSLPDHYTDSGSYQTDYESAHTHSGWLIGGPDYWRGGGSPSPSERISNEGNSGSGGGHNHDVQGNSGYKIFWDDGAIGSGRIDKYFRDAADTANYGNYQKMSNWILKPITAGGSAGLGQNFIEPPFKGTYIAINLKGARNPVRGNSIIQDFDFIGGVPVCGRNNDYKDMTWDSLIMWENITDTTGTIDYIYTSNAQAFNYKIMQNHDNTMHPNTYVNWKERSTGTLHYDQNDNTPKIQYKSNSRRWEALDTSVPE